MYLNIKDIKRRITLFFCNTLAINDLKNIVDGKDIAIIGNAQSLFDKNKGADIDKADVVIRINAGIIRDKKQQGNKTTIWASSFDMSEEDVVKNFNPKICIWLSPKAKVMHKYKKSFLKKIYIFPLKFWYRLYKILGRKRPTSGIMLINLLLTNCEPKSINLYGFDFFDTNTFYNKIDIVKLQQTTPHSFSREKEYVQNLTKKFNIKIN